MAGPEQLIDKLDAEHDNLVSINDLETNIGRLVVDKNTNELQELGLLLKQEDGKIESAFQITNNSNILQDLYVDLSKIEASELTPNQEKILQLCLYAGIDVLQAEQETLISIGNAILVFDPYVSVPTENLKKHESNVRSPGRVIRPILDPSIFGGLNQTKISDIFGRMTQINPSVKNNVTDAEKEIIYKCNYEEGYSLDNALSTCYFFEQTLANDIKNERNKALANQLLVQIKDIETQIKSLISKKERLNKLLEEKIPLNQLLHEVGLPQVNGLSPQKGMTITRREGKMAAMGAGTQKTYFNYYIQNGDTHISLGYSEGIGYTVAGYFQNPFNPLFGGEHPLHEKMNEFYNYLGYKGDIRKNLREVNSLDETGLSESAKALLTTPLNEDGSLSLLGHLSQEDIYMMIYILTGKIKIKEDAQLIRIQDIKGLHLNNNQLSSLPPEIGEFQSLRILSLADNQLSSLPPEIGNLVQLEYLYLSNNQLSSLPPEIGEFQSLRTLSLADNQLSSLPPEIGNLVQLEYLYLSNNQLSSLPPEIGEFQSLRTLSLADNQLSSLPPEIGNLVQLEYLYLSNNQLSSLPPEIGNLGKLEGLLLDNNQLSSLPPEIGNLGKLEYLYLFNNQLSSLPPEIGEFQSLRTLSLADNQLSSLPPEIGNLRKLEYLYLNNNQITNLPDLNHLNPHRLDARYNLLPYSEKLKLPNESYFSPQIGEEENVGEGGDNGEGMRGDVSEISERQPGEYRDNIRRVGNPANDILSATPGVSDLSSFDYDIGNAMPGSKDKLNPVLISSIESPLQDNYRGAIFDVQYDSKTNASSKVKIEGKYQKARIKNVDLENVEVHTMILGRLDAGTHQIVLPLGARIVDKGKGDYTMEQDEETGLYRVVVPEKTSVDNLMLQFVVEQETRGHQTDRTLNQYKNILPNIGPRLETGLSAADMASVIKSRVQDNSYYGFDTEFDSQLSQYKLNPVEYCQKLYEEGTKRYEGKMMMVCNQSALLTVLLLKKNGIPARVAVGIPGYYQASGPGHAWTEYRDGEKRQKLDATPSDKPPQNVAQEMYSRQKIIKNQIQEKIRNDKKAEMEKIVGDFNALPEAIRDKVPFGQYIEELNFENIPITTKQLAAVIDMISLNRRTSGIKILSLSGSGITDFPSNMWKFQNLEFLDIGNTDIASSNYNKLLSLYKLTSVSAPENRHNDPAMPETIKNILSLQEILVKSKKNKLLTNN